MQESADRATLTLRAALPTFAEMQSAISAEAITSLMNAKNIEAIDKQYFANHKRAQEKLAILGDDNLNQLKTELNAKIDEDVVITCRLNFDLMRLAENETNRKKMISAQIQKTSDECKILQSKVTQVEDPNKTPPKQRDIDDRLFEDFAKLQEQQIILKELIDADKVQKNLAEQEMEAVKFQLDNQRQNALKQREIYKHHLERGVRQVNAEKEDFSYKMWKEYAAKQYEIKLRLANEELRAKAARESLEAECNAAGFAIEDFIWVFVKGQTPSKDKEERYTTSVSDGK